MTAKVENLAARRQQKRAGRGDSVAPAGTAREEQAGPSSGSKCPVCGRPRSHRYRPFCSSRCAKIDLGRWLKESYRVPTQDRAPAAEDESET
jgi:endogenous inhibitor of DNA gyrase (YacG/DUF329 family)